MQEKNASVVKVSKRYGIPRSTLSSKLHSPCPLAKKMTGKGTALVQEEEEAIKTWILEKSASEELLSWETIASTLQQILNERGLNIFKNNNKPTSGWLQAFMRRHPELRKVRLGPWSIGIVATPTTGGQDEEGECEGWIKGGRSSSSDQCSDGLMGLSVKNISYFCIKDFVFITMWQYEWYICIYKCAFNLHMIK